MIRPKKHLGQHFLRDENIARKIIASVSPGARNIVEIGPGTGILTKYILLNHEWNSFFYEIDHESVDYLGSHYPATEKKLFHEDFLTADLSRIPAPFSVIGNFPYNISSQIMFRILEHRKDIPEVVGMFQKEVAERLASPPGTRKSGILSVLLNAWYDIEYLFTINENVFYPPPKVKSALVRITRNNTLELDCDEEQFFRVVKTAFNQRRKQLRNALKGLTLTGSPTLSGLLTKRAEQLSVSDFVLLTRESDSGNPG